MNNGTGKSGGIGIVNLCFTSGKTITLVDVLFVPRLRKNLVSGVCLNTAGFKQVIGFGYFFSCFLSFECDKIIFLVMMFV